MHVSNLWLLAISVQIKSFLGSFALELCDSARNHCLSRVGCHMALNNFFVGCNDVIYDKADTCTTDCKHALISLLSTEDSAGLAFINCNCSGNEFCDVRKKRVEICTKDVLEFMSSIDDKNSVVSCTLARWICEADTSCLTALEYYARHCAKLVHGERCSARCNNSLGILYRQANSKKLQTCICDGSEEYDCQKLKDNTERLCFHREPKAVPYNTVSKRPRGPADGGQGHRSGGDDSQRRPSGRRQGSVRRTWRKNKTRRARHLKFRKSRYGGRRRNRKRRVRKRRAWQRAQRSQRVHRTIRAQMSPARREPRRIT